MQWADIFPVGDLAAETCLKKVKGLLLSIIREELVYLVGPWKSYRTEATMLLWHYYLSQVKNKLNIFKRVVNEITRQAKILRSFAADKKEIAGDF